MAVYNVFDTTNMAAVKFAERIYDAVATTDIENGTFGYLNGLADGESHTYNFVAGTKAGAQVVVANHPAWDEDTCRITNQRRDKYIIPAGERFRVYVVKIGDEFATAIEGITSATQSVVTGVTDFTANDVFVTIDASTGKLVASKTTAVVEGSENTTASIPIMEGRIMRKRIMGGTLVTALRSYGNSKGMYTVKVATLA